MKTVKCYTTHTACNGPDCSHEPTQKSYQQITGDSTTDRAVGGAAAPDRQEYTRCTRCGKQIHSLYEHCMACQSALGEDLMLAAITAPASPAHTPETLTYKPLFSRLTWGSGTCAEFIGCKDAADELGEEMVKRWNQAAEIKRLRDALTAAVQYLEKHRPKGNIRDIFSELNEYENGVMKPARAALEGGAK